MKLLKGKIRERIQPSPRDSNCSRTYAIYCSHRIGRCMPAAVTIGCLRTNRLTHYGHGRFVEVANVRPMIVLRIFGAGSN